MAIDPVTGNESNLAETGRSVMREGKRMEKKDFKANLKELDDIEKGVKGVTEEVDKLTESFNKAGAASKGVQAPGATKKTGAAGTPLPPVFANQFTTDLQKEQQQGLMRSGGFGGGAFGGLRGVANQGLGPKLIGANILATTAGQIAGMGMARAERGMDYASAADKLNVLTQQMTGMSQMAVLNQRKPLQNYRIGGQAGVNAMVEFQSRTGVQADAAFAKSIEGIRTLTGYSKSTADVLADQQALLNPDVANRMFMYAGGTNAYTSGGKFNDPLKMRQQLVKQFGLADPGKTGGMTPGSVDRMRMTQAGVPVELQDELLQFGQSQKAYAKKGGKGDYDPSNPQHRKLMGIEGNYATQQEETEKTKGKREEDYMRRNIDNMAKLEKSNQALIRALGRVEDKLSGGIGKQIQNRNWLGALGSGLQIGGMAMMLAPGVGTAAGAAMMVTGSAIGATSGDGPIDDGSGAGAGRTPSSSAANDANIKVPLGYPPHQKRISLNDLKGHSDFQKVDSRLRDRLLAMFRENPNVGVGDSFRSEAEQEAMFRDRYTPTSTKTDRFWKGTYWKHVKGAPAAPPGRSFHEVGLASDLVGDLKWMNANAGRFGLKHFANVNNEPWHVQLAELPNSRSAWEKAGGIMPEDSGIPSTAGGSEPVMTGDDGGSSGGMGGGMSASMLSLFGSDSIGDILSGGGLGGSGSSLSRRSGGVGSTSSGGSVSGAAVGNGQLTGEQVAALAYQAGFRGQALIDVVAISKRESGWNTSAHNGDRGTGDNSFGLMQINMIDKLGPARLQQFGISKYEDLLDGATNMRAAFVLSGGGQNLSPWGAYKGESNTYNTNVAEAAEIVTNAGYSGDPMPEAGGGMGSSSFVSNTRNNITFSPNIQISGSGSTPDLRRIAKEAIALMKEELDLMTMRSGA